MAQGTRDIPLRRVEVQQRAAELFAERGYHGTSMKDIAAAVDVTAANLYNHFASKQRILYDVMDIAMVRATDALQAAISGIDDPAERLHRATESLVLDFLRYPAEVTVCNVEIRSLDEPHKSAIIAKRDAYAATVRAIIDDGFRRGRFHTEDPRLAAFAILEMGNSAKAWFHAGGGLTDIDVARRYGEFARRVVVDIGLND